MEEIEEEKDINSEEVKTLKSDWKSVLLYVLMQFIIPVIAGVIIGIITGLKGNGTPETILNFSYLITSVMLIINFVVFFLIYKKRIITDFKKINKKMYLILFILSIVILALNFGICEIFDKFDIEMMNQDAIIDMYKHYPVLTVVSTLLAALVEEIAFRYGLKTIIKNNTAFVIISSIIFGALHGLGVVTFLYVFIGMCFSLIYIKTDDNIAASTFVHFLNNVVGVLSIVLGI